MQAALGVADHRVGDLTDVARGAIQRLVDEAARHLHASPAGGTHQQRRNTQRCKRFPARR